MANLGQSKEAESVIDEMANREGKEAESVIDNMANRGQGKEAEFVSKEMQNTRQGKESENVTDDVANVEHDKKTESSVESDEAVSDYYDQDVDSHDSTETHSALMNDINLLESFCGNDAICHSVIHEMSVMILKLSFPATLLQKIEAEAWGLSCDQPLILRFDVNQRYYLDTEVGKEITVYQNSYSEKPGVLRQLEQIADAFIKKQFQELTNQQVTNAISEGSDDSNDDLHSELMEMGFTRDDVLLAQRSTDGSRTMALYFLLDQQGKEVSGTDHTVQSVSLDKAKEIPSLRNGFLVQLYLYIEKRLLTLTSFCLICDNTHNLVRSEMRKPVTCSNKLCQYSHQTLGINADVTGNIVSEPEVVDLLIKLTTAAVQSRRRGLVLNPYPTVPDPCKTTELAMNPENKDYGLVEKVIYAIPSVPEMLKSDHGQFMKMLNDCHELCYPLLRWIILSNRLSIEKLRSDVQLSFMDTKHQFWVRCGLPLEDSQFRMHKRTYGSVFAFHGSPIENWHSILRNGLVVASGTELMIHGAVSGSGIYLSPFLHTSLTYCNTRAANYNKTDVYSKQETSPDYIVGRPIMLKCIALCEVIECPNLVKKNTIWKCDSSEYVCPRFLFLVVKNNFTLTGLWSSFEDCFKYDRNTMADSLGRDICTTTPAIHEQLKQITTDKWSSDDEC